MKTEISIERLDGQIISAIYGKPPEWQKNDAPLIILVHGFPKNQSKTSNFFGLLADIIREQGYGTLEFDFVHCAGDNPPTQNFTLDSAQQDMLSLFAWARENGYQNLAFIAEGFGAPVTFINLPENARFCILCWPVFDLSYVRNGQFKADEHAAHLQEHGYLDHRGFHIGQAFLDELDSFDLIPFLENAHTPTLILHGKEDVEIPPSHLDVAYEHLDTPRLEVTLFDDGEYGLADSNHRKACLHYIKEFVRIHGIDTHG